MSSREPLELSKLSEKDFKFIKKLSFEQQDMVNKLYKHKRVLVDAIAGSGKTTIITQAMKALKDKGHISTIYYVVFPVQEDSLGYLPGGVGEKIAEYALPFIQALTKAGVNPHELDVETVCDPLVMGDYKVVPHTFFRGRTYEGVGGIIDEIQNGTVEEIKKTLTRFEDDCYMAMIGHNGQIDIKPEDSGFSLLINHFKRGKETGVYTGVEFAHLTHNYRGPFSSFVDQMGKTWKPKEEVPGTPAGLPQEEQVI